ncbi:MAG: 3-deoxy-D-manno-octulosonic acid transferase [Cypionkella sp.]
MRALTRLLLPIVPLVMLAVALWRRITGAEPAFALGERLGHLPAPQGPSVWLHGASNGEIASARWVIEALLADRPGLCVLVTANTATARAMVTGWGLPGVTAAFAPLDLRWPLSRLLRTWQPKALITVEGEIYPRRFATCAKAGIPVLLIGARMSERSFRGWKELQPVMAKALGTVRMASAQDQASADRLLALGLPAPVLAAPCDLKAVAIQQLPAPDTAPRSARVDWLLAASTHAGEEEIVLDAYLETRDRFRHLILAPRHPRRGDEVAALVTARGLSLARRSAGAMPSTEVGAGAETETVFLADTMGEMDLWYSLSGACFVGGSFAPKGGHSPWEPARHGCAILHGPSVGNFANPYAALDASGGAVALRDPADLSGALQGLDAARQDEMSRAAAKSLDISGDGAALFHTIMTVAAL